MIEIPVKAKMTAAPSETPEPGLTTWELCIVVGVLATLGVAFGAGWLVHRSQVATTQAAKAQQPPPVALAEPKPKPEPKSEYWEMWVRLTKSSLGDNLSGDEISYACLIAEEQHVGADEALRQLRVNQFEVYFAKRDDRVPPPNPNLFATPPNKHTPRSYIVAPPPGREGVPPPPRGGMPRDERPLRPAPSDGPATRRVEPLPPGSGVSDRRVKPFPPDEAPSGIDRPPSK